MEALLSQFIFLSDQALHDKNFDPSTIEDLMKLFEVDSYKEWAVLMELEQEKQAKEAEQAEEYLNSVMENAMDELRRFELEMERLSKAELTDLEMTAEKTQKMGNSKEKAVTVASKKYIEATANRASDSMKSAWKGVSPNKVHP